MADTKTPNTAATSNTLIKEEDLGAVNSRSVVPATTPSTKPPKIKCSQNTSCDTTLPMGS